MKIQQKKYSLANGWETIRGESFDTAKAQLVLVFAGRDVIADGSIYESLKQIYTSADIIMNSTAGEILDVQVYDDGISLTAIAFERTTIRTSIVTVTNSNTSFDAGKQLALDINREGLKSVLVISDGQRVNGSELVKGLAANLPANIIITGGLAGDGPRFERTLVGLNELPVEGRVVIVGFYGDHLIVNSGSMGGWDSFGPERLITKAVANELFELDGKPALDVYKLYLGDYAPELPGSGLLFPLCIRGGEDSTSVVRTIIAVDEEKRSLTFAGNMPEGSMARLMKANFDRLIDGASNAAKNSIHNTDESPELAVLISCVGRKLVLGNRTDEEVEVVRAVYGNETAITGFYSYGEISPSFTFLRCELHNQTMTITTFRESV